MVLSMIENEVTTAIGTPNIALVKYWGKRNEELNLPMNSSISITLDENLNTKTSVMFTDKLESDLLYINKEKQDINSLDSPEKLRFIKKTLEFMRNKSGFNKKALIVSENSFPTSSGIASSASGGATLVFALSSALNLHLSKREMSIIARQISGSACRSVYGGVVEWRKGKKIDGSDSYAKQVIEPDYWNELRDIIAIVDGTKKKISSSLGHQATIATSTLYKARPKHADAEVKIIKEAIKRRDFQGMAEIIMKDSNNMHATMLDTWPPIMYLNDNSKEIIYAIHELNDKKNKYVAAYTFDAGANAHIITTADYADDVFDVLKGISGIKSTIQSGLGMGPKIKNNGSLIDVDKLGPK